MDTPSGPEWLMESHGLTGVKVMTADRLPAWCLECKGARWADGQEIRDALRTSERILTISPNGVLRSLLIERPGPLG